jgi:hypothetical protein
MARRGQGRGSTAGAPADDPPARPSGPSLPARRRHPHAHPTTSATRAQKRHRQTADRQQRTQFETLHQRHKTATLIVLSGVGLDTSGETIPYIAGWGESGALEAVTDHAGLIDRLARTIEDAIATTDPQTDVDISAATRP